MVMNIALRIWLPTDGALHVPWLAPVVEAVLIVVLVTSDPSNRTERVRLRRTAVILVSVFVAASLWATAVLISDLVTGASVTQSPDELLASGGLVWFGNNIAFALFY